MARSGTASKPSPPAAPPRRTVREIVAAEPAFALVPLRAFLGVVFCFAGLQKLANPNFFRASSPISIQAQLVAAQRSSPLHHLLHPLMSVATPLGVVIALSELAIGLGVLTGILTRVAAAGGMVLSFMLFLTVSFHSRPFYTGADIGYVFAFTPLLIAGPGILTLPAFVDRLVPVEAVRRRHPRPGLAGLADRLPVDQSRRDALVTGVVLTGGLVLAALDAAFGRLAKGTRAPQQVVQLGAPADSTTSPTTAAAPSTTTANTTAQSPATTAAPRPAPSTTVAPKPSGVPGGTLLGPASDVPVGGAASFRDPSSGDPGIVIQAKAGQFVAFDAVCPHAGCTVGYDNSQRLIVCPCHGSVFNASTGAVEQGPAASNLREYRIAEGSDGNLYLT